MKMEDMSEGFEERCGVSLNQIEKIANSLSSALMKNMQGAKNPGLVVNLIWTMATIKVFCALKETYGASLGKMVGMHMANLANAFIEAEEEETGE